MNHARIALALIALLSLTPPRPVDAVSTDVVVQIVAATGEQAGHAGWALSRFEAAGLEIPSLRIVFHDDYQSCGMREGVLRITGDAIAVHECEPDPARLRRSLLHELAHAWDYHGTQITAEQRSEFLKLRGLASWDDDGQPWNRRGEEQAAEIIAWGLMHRPAPIPTSVRDYGPQHPADLARAFILLTGVAPRFDHPGA